MESTCSRTMPLRWGACAVLLHCAAAAADPSTSLTITGGVQHPATVTAAKLQAEPAGWRQATGMTAS